MTEKSADRRTPEASLPHVPATAGLDIYEIRNDVEALHEPASPTARPVGWGFLILYWLAFVGLWIPVLSPLLVTLALKVNGLVGPAQAGASLGVVVSAGGLLAMLANPFFGRMSDATTSRLGMRRPWIVFGLVGGAVATLGMALAPSVTALAIAFAATQCLFNACTAGLFGVLADQVPPGQRGMVGGLIGASVPLALPAGSFLVQLVSPNLLAMFLLPLAVGAIPLLLFTVLLKDRILPVAEKPAFSWRDFLGTFWVNPLRHRDFGYNWWAKFFFVFAYAFLTTYQAFFLIQRLGIPATSVPALIFQSTLVLSAMNLISSLGGGKLSDVLRRRKIFVIVAALIYGAGLFVIASSTTFELFLVGIGIAGFGFGAWGAVDTALTVDVLPNPSTAAKDLAVANIANTLPQSLAPAIAPLILASAGGSYPVLYAVAAACAVFSALFVLPIKSAR